ncbi:RNA-binding protein 42 [Strongyloides ratti]|uniref:RNA-binding protein 42 n=1 Tax=Strongyloides ratti TaxID=34506 RepID=A0A090MZ38_STRRB|nr:RNA-binding protein 42 [Strongyloides ratti]CEF68259.1 RNA-binding protein 42 [Strongyloides ratti]
MADLEDPLDAFFKEISQLEAQNTANNEEDSNDGVVSNDKSSNTNVVLDSDAKNSFNTLGSTTDNSGKFLKSAVISSAPQLYTDFQGAKKSSTNETVTQLKPLALPSDVELVTQKKKAEEAYRNSYLGQVMRGEKKMKRFIRCAGGQKWEDPSLAEWDPNDFRIFCGDLGNEVNDDLLTRTFRDFPSFQKAKVIRDSRTGKSKGYGFVSFRKQEGFIKAMKEMDGKYVGNRPIKLRKSNWDERNLEIVKKKKREKAKMGLC